LKLSNMLQGIALCSVVTVFYFASDRHEHLTTNLQNAALAAVPSNTFRRPQSLPEDNSKITSLRSDAARAGLYFGSMQDSTNAYWRLPWVQDLAGSEFNLIEPGNQLKWWVVHPSRSTFNFAPADAFVEYAIAHNMRVRGHTLLWGMGNPDWLGNFPAASYKLFSGRELEEILVHHIRNVMGHYRDKYPGIVRWWDVTNEVMGWNNKFNTDGIEWTNIGTNPDRADYLRVAFRTARATDPDAVLCMNDWGNEGSVPDRTQNLIDTVKRFRAEGIPIDCVGMEGHLDLDSAPSYAQVYQTMRAYADIGVQVQITEFDIKAKPSAANWNQAAAVASAILAACLDSSNCTAFNNWGFTQAIYPNGLDGKSLVMLPWDGRGQATPEYTAMRETLKGSRNGRTP
jgi:endo-1,4-beta-xylanase